WTNQDVTVTFTCADQGGSGVAGCSAPVSKTTEGEGQQVSGTATDNAGNSATNTAVVSIDKTAPTISAAPDRAPNGAGWYNDAVTGEGANLSSSATCTDKAGNTATKTVSGIQIDRTAPSTQGSVPDPLASGWYAGPVEVTLTGDDNLSGVAHTYYKVDGGAA